MCVVALALAVHPDWPVILVGNRDEYHARPAAPLHEWTDGSAIIAGQDLQAGGTWMGVHPPTGRMVVVTNVRGGLPDPTKASRGALVTQLLSGTGPYATIGADPDSTPAMLDDFNAFNLIMVSGGTGHILTNRPTPDIRPIHSGIFALANEPASAPCPRADTLRSRLAHCVANASDPQHLLNDLMDCDPPALFLTGDIYGTRASTLFLQNRAGEIFMTERQYEAGGRPHGTTALLSQIG